MDKVSAGPARDRPGIERDSLGLEAGETPAQFAALKESLSGATNGAKAP